MISVVQSSKHLNSMTRQLVASKVFSLPLSISILEKTSIHCIVQSTARYRGLLLFIIESCWFLQPSIIIAIEERESCWVNGSQLIMCSLALLLRCVRARCNSIKFKVSALLVIIVEEKKGADSWSSSASSARINDGWRILTILWSVGVATHCRHCHRCRKKSNSTTHTGKESWPHR